MATTTPVKDPHERLVRRMQDRKKTFEAKDVDGIMSCYAEGEAFSAFEFMPPIGFHGGDMWRQNRVAFFAAWQGPLSLEFADLEVHATDDLGFVRSFARLVGTMYGQEVDLWTRVTNCFRRIDGEWLMIHDHVSVPIDLATGKALLNLSPAKPLG